MWRIRSDRCFATGGSVTADVSRYSYLIVNADDYGYHDCVSKGILSAARQGIVTATGIFGE